MPRPGLCRSWPPDEQRKFLQLIEKEQSVEGLVLGAGGDIADGGEVGEKALDFFLAGEGWRHVLDGVAVALEPLNNNYEPFKIC